MALATQQVADHYCSYCNVELDEYMTETVTYYVFESCVTRIPVESLEECETEDVVKCTGCGDGDDIVEYHEYYTCGQCGANSDTWLEAAQCCMTLECSCETVHPDTCFYYAADKTGPLEGHRLLFVDAGETDDLIAVCPDCHKLWVRVNDFEILDRSHVCERTTAHTSPQPHIVIASQCEHFKCPVCKDGYCGLHNCHGKATT